MRTFSMPIGPGACNLSAILNAAPSITRFRGGMSEDNHTTAAIGVVFIAPVTQRHASL